MDRLNQKYIALLSKEGPLASEKFWRLWERIREDRKDAGVSMEMKRSKTDQNLLSLLMEGAVSLKDLNDFSDGLQGKNAVSDAPL